MKIIWPYARGKKCQQKSSGPVPRWDRFGLICLPSVLLLVLLTSGSWPVTLCTCAACAAIACIAPIARKEWRKYQAGRALAQYLAATKPDRHTCGRPDFWSIIYDSYSRGELAPYEERGEVLRANRGHP